MLGCRRRGADAGLQFSLLRVQQTTPDGPARRRPHASVAGDNLIPALLLGAVQTPVHLGEEQ